MSTLMICPVCKGIRAAAAGSAAGRRCTCTTAESGSGGAPKSVIFSSSDSSSSNSGGTAVATKVKVCSVCGIDVTDKKRMKDGTTGRYWCYDCGAADEMHRDPHSLVICPQCKKAYLPSRMVKHGETYICTACHTRDYREHHRKAGNGKHKAAIVTALIVGGAVAVGLVVMYVSGVI